MCSIIYMFLNIYIYMYTYIHRKLKKRKWTLLVLEETEIDQYIYCIKYLTHLKPLMVNSFNNLDFNNYEVCLYYVLFF